MVAKYVYFRDGKDPTPEDVVNSETLEGRLREGFVRIRQLLVSSDFIYSLAHNKHNMQRNEGPLAQ